MEAGVSQIRCCNWAQKFHLFTQLEDSSTLTYFKVGTRAVVHSPVPPAPSSALNNPLQLCTTQHNSIQLCIFLQICIASVATCDSNIKLLSMHHSCLVIPVRSSGLPGYPEREKLWPARPSTNESVLVSSDHQRLQSNP